MHIPDGWVDLPTSAAAGVVAAGGVAVSARRAGAALRDRVTSLPAVIAAYLLVAQLLVVPVGLGTSAHLVGTGLAALLVGPSITILCVAVVVVVQALVLADGGVTALGLNLVNDGIVPALVAWGVFALLRPVLTSRRALAVGGGVAAGLASLAAAGAATLEFVVGRHRRRVAGDRGRQHRRGAPAGGRPRVGAHRPRPRHDPAPAPRPGPRRPAAPRRGNRTAGRARGRGRGRRREGAGAMSASHAAGPAPDRLRGPLSGLAPEVKVVGLVAFLLAVAVTPPSAPWALAAQGAVAVAVAGLALVDPRAVAGRLALDLPLAVLAVVYALAGKGPHVEVLGLSLSQPGLRVGLAILAKATIGIVAVSALAASTSVPATIAGLARLGVPAWFRHLLALSVRQLQVLRADLARIRRAVEVRTAATRRSVALAAGARSLGGCSCGRPSGPTRCAWPPTCGAATARPTDGGRPRPPSRPPGPGRPPGWRGSRPRWWPRERR